MCKSDIHDDWLKSLKILKTEPIKLRIYRPNIHECGGQELKGGKRGPR